MTIWKAGALALLIPVALAAPVLAQDAGHQGPPRMMFEELDADGDGAVTLQEMRDAGANRFANADTDGDGALSRDELLARAQARAQARAEQRVDRMLGRMDADGDGQITQAEMEQAREDRGGGRGHEQGQGHGRRGPDPERLFQRLDADGDGAVTQAEFDEGVATFMERMAGRHGGRHNDRFDND